MHKKLCQSKFKQWLESVDETFCTLLKGKTNNLGPIWTMNVWPLEGHILFTFVAAVFSDFSSCNIHFHQFQPTVLYVFFSLPENLYMSTGEEIYFSWSNFLDLSKFLSASFDQFFAPFQAIFKTLCWLQGLMSLLLSELGHFWALKVSSDFLGSLLSHFMLTIFNFPTVPGSAHWDRSGKNFPFRAIIELW